MASLKLVHLLHLAILLAIATTSSTCNTSSSSSSLSSKFSSSSSSSSSIVKGIYWKENPFFPPSSINTSLFTHIFYAFLSPNNVTYKLEVPTTIDTSLRTFTNTLQNKSPPAATLISIGGASNNSTLFALIVSDPTARATFINSTIDVARTFGFHGLDLNWEFPQTIKEMNDLGEFFCQWRLAINYEAIVTKRPPLLLTSAVYYAAGFFLSGESRTYPVDSINKNLDWVNVMTYDFHGSWNNVTGAPTRTFDPNRNISMVSGLVSWIRAGALREKIVMGMTLNGKTWELKDPNVHGMGAPIVGVGPGQEGQMAYFQVLDFNRENSANVVYDMDTMSVYSYSGTTWIGYEDPLTISVKVGFAQALSLRGYFFWVAGLDTIDWKISTQASRAWILV